MEVSAPATGMGLVAVLGAATGGTGVSKASESLSDSSWSRIVGHSPCAWCWLLGVTRVFASSPDLVCMGVCVCNSLANFKLDQLVSRRAMGQVKVPGIHVGVPGRQKGHASTWGTCKFACAWELRECRVCAFTSDLQS